MPILRLSLIPRKSQRKLRPRNRNQARTESETVPLGPPPPMHSTPVSTGTGSVPIEPSVPPTTPPSAPQVQPSPTLDAPEEREAQQDVGEIVWNSMPDAPHVGNYPVVDSEGFFSTKEQTAITDTIYGTSTTGLKSVGTYLDLASNLLKRMLLVGAKATGATPIIDYKLALQISPGANHVQLAVNKNSEWLFAVHPLQGMGLLDVNTWSQLEQQVIYALSDGKTDNISANAGPIRTALEGMKTLYMNRFAGMQQSTGVYTNLLDLEKVFGQREQFMSGIDQFFHTIRFSLDPAKGEETSRFEITRDLAKASSIYQGAPRTSGGYRVLRPSNVPLTAGILSNPILNRFGKVLNFVTEEVLHRAAMSVPRFKEIIPNFDGASILLPWHTKPGIHFGHWWATNDKISKFTVSSNMFGPMTQGV